MNGKTSAKAERRSKIRQALRELPATDRIAQSADIRNQLIFPAGSRVAIFAGTQTEVQLLDLLKSAAEVQWLLPRVVGDSEMEFLPVDHSTPLKKGAFGIMEPTHGTPASELDAIVCPGLAFTLQGDRLGQGGGFYDRALAKFPSAEFIGVCFKLQIFDELPTEKHDLKMDRLVTPLREC